MRRAVVACVLLFGCRGDVVAAGAADSGDPIMEETGADAGPDTPAPPEAGSETAAETGAPSDAAKDAAEDTQTSGGCGTHAGGPMVRLGGFCMDVTEVTRGAYNELLALGPAERAAAAPSWCNWNTVTGSTETNASFLNLPVGSVNLCDAATYCAWAGKRLCGKIGGGANTSASGNDPSRSEWFYACSADGTQDYAYPGPYDASRCIADSTTVQLVGAATACTASAAPFSALRDLSGNITEWDLACEGTALPIATTRCRARGGDWALKEATRCDHLQTQAAASRFAGQGFRCCKD